MLVSILIPCFNAGKYIAAAIDSALAQTWSEKEVIVVDDGSTDGSLDVIKRYDGRIRWETGPNRGGGYARNRLLNLAQGEWVQYLDADDLLFPEKVERQLAFARGHPELDVVCSPTVLERRVNGDFVCEETHFPQAQDPWRMLASWDMPQTAGPLWKRTALERVSGWKSDQPCCQEHELYLRLLMSGTRFGFLDENLSLYRIWEMGTRLVERMQSQVPQQRLLILQRMEDFLRAQGQLTPDVRQAINDARHRLARQYWERDRKEARRVMGVVAQSDITFVPSRSDASSSLYRWVYRLLGFHGAEALAALRRVV